jgi:hypothetical protein
MLAASGDATTHCQHSVVDKLYNLLHTTISSRGHLLRVLLKKLAHCCLLTFSCLPALRFFCAAVLLPRAFFLRAPSKHNL